MSSIGIALLSALATSVLTWLLAWLFYRSRLSQRMDALREDIASELEERVRRGVLSAGEEMLPEFRKQVTEGFLDAVRRTGTVSGMAKTSAEIVGSSLENWFGPRRR